MRTSAVRRLSTACAKIVVRDSGRFGHIAHALPPRYARAYGQLSDPNTFELLQGPEGRVIIDNYNEQGFAIQGTICVGSVFIHDKLHAAWSPRKVKDITPESLAALELLEPKPDLVVIGTGKQIVSLSEDVERYLREIDVKVETGDTANAASTFNVLVEEGRCVAGALLPVGSS